MKYLKKFFKWLLILIILIIAVLYITDTDYLLKAVRTIYLNGHSTAFLEDYKYFDNSVVEAGDAHPWPEHADYNSVDETEVLKKTNAELGTVAYLIIKNDSIWYEAYYDGYGKDSKSNSFSMVKSMVSGMMGKAITDGYLKGLDQPVGDFFPEFSEGMAARTTVGDLSSMASGTNWDEAYYSPLSITTRAYFDDDLKKVILGLKVVEEPGQKFKYASGDIQLLAMVLEKATGKPLNEYLSESFWKPLGASQDAPWQLDSEEGGMVKAYCCVAGNARDFARFGKLYKDHGKWRGEQLLDSSFVALSLRPRFEESPQYGYGWWLYTSPEGKSFYMMRGHLGQYVIVNREDNVMIVRLGRSKSNNKGVGVFTKDIDIYIDEGYKMLGAGSQ